MSARNGEMPGSKVVENGREVVFQEEGEKEAIASGNEDLALGGKRERRLVLKMDLYLIPLIMLLYTFSFLDRCVITYKYPNKLTKYYQSQHWKCSALQYGERLRSGR